MLKRNEKSPNTENNPVLLKFSFTSNFNKGFYWRLFLKNTK